MGGLSFVIAWVFRECQVDLNNCQNVENLFNLFIPHCLHISGTRSTLSFFASFISSFKQLDKSKFNDKSTQDLTITWSQLLWCFDNLTDRDQVHLIDFHHERIKSFILLFAIDWQRLLSEGNSKFHREIWGSIIHNGPWSRVKIRHQAI
jgi:hypothetical protein